MSNRQPAGATVRPSGMYISQVARILGVSPAVVRAWEDEGLVSPARTESGYRVFSPQDVERLRRVRDLIHRDGLNAAGVRHLLENEGPRIEQRPRAKTSSVHERIQMLRKRKGMSLRTLAAMSSLSASSVSAIERGRSAPSVGTLQRIAAALETTVPQLLNATPGSRKLVVRPDERQVLNMETPGVLFENLYAVDTVLQSILISVEPGHGSEESYSHEGEEFLYIVEGELDLTLDELETYRLAPGDAMTFRSTRPHRWRNPGDVRTTIVWVNTPPTF